MELHLRVAGDGPPLALLHGLFESNEDLSTVARAVRPFNSLPHGSAQPRPFAARPADELPPGPATCERPSTPLARAARRPRPPLGCKTAMELALSESSRVERLIVVDIAPIKYDRRHKPEHEALGPRKDADDALAPSLPSPAIRQFLLKNLVRGEDGFEWRIPLGTPHHESPNGALAPLLAGPDAGPVLFARGAASDYVRVPAVILATGQREQGTPRRFRHHGARASASAVPYNMNNRRTG